jgi:hypothetical protein
MGKVEISKMSFITGATATAGEVKADFDRRWTHGKMMILQE